MNKPNTLRTKLGKFPTPKQHGAWAMFIIPSLLVMGVVQNIDFVSVGVFLGYIVVFLSYQPATDFVRYFRKNAQIDFPLLFWIFILGGTGSALVIAPIVYYSKWQALFFGGVVVFALNIHLWLTLKKEHMSVFGELFGIAGLTASAPLMFIYLQGNLDTTGWLLWYVSYLYFGGSVFYVKLAVYPKKESDQRTKLENKLLLYNGIILVSLCGLIFFTGLSIWILSAFIPFIIKSINSVYTKNPIKQKPRRIGIKELIHATYFLVASILSFS